MGSYLDDINEDSVDADVLRQLNRLAERQVTAEQAVDKAAEELEQKKQQLRDISERQIPALMDEAGLTELKTNTGLTLRIDEQLRTSIPKKHEGEAFRWLREHGYSGLIKRVLSVQFGKGEDQDAETVRSELAESGYEVDDKTSVAPSTLRAFVRERLAEGTNIPQDVFGVHRQRFAKIDRG